MLCCAHGIACVSVHVCIRSVRWLVPRLALSCSSGDGFIAAATSHKPPPAARRGGCNVKGPERETQASHPAVTDSQRRLRCDQVRSGGEGEVIHSYIVKPNALALARRGSHSRRRQET